MDSFLYFSAYKKNCGKTVNLYKEITVYTPPWGFDTLPSWYDICGRCNIKWGMNSTVPWIQSSVRLRSIFKFLKQKTKKKDINSLLFYQFYTEDLVSIVLSGRKCNRSYRQLEQIHHLISLYMTGAADMFLQTEQNEDKCCNRCTWHGETIQSK